LLRSFAATAGGWYGGLDQDQTAAMILPILQQAKNEEAMMAANWAVTSLNPHQG
jgi:hypothetical protein